MEKISSRIKVYLKNIKIYEDTPLIKADMIKVFHPNSPYYIKLISIPAVIIIIGLIIFNISSKDTSTINSIIVGILGSYIASVVVSWLIEIYTCKEKSLQRMRFQRTYFSCLLDICEKCILYYLSNLGENWHTAYIEQTEVGCKLYNSNFKGYPWQYWAAIYIELVQSNYPDFVDIFENVHYSKIEYDGQEDVNNERTRFEDFTRAFIETNFNSDTEVAKWFGIIDQYRTSVSAVYVNDYISKLQEDAVYDLLEKLEIMLKCVVGKDVDNFWPAYNYVLDRIDSLSHRLYPFWWLNKTENICMITGKTDSSDAFARIDKLVDSVNKDGEYSYIEIPRKMQREIKATEKLTQTFESEDDHIHINK